MEKFQTELKELIAKHKVFCILAAVDQNRTEQISGVYGDGSIVDINTLNNEVHVVSCEAIENKTGKTKNKTLGQKVLDAICNR